MALLVCLILWYNLFTPFNLLPYFSFTDHSRRRSNMNKNAVHNPDSLQNSFPDKAYLQHEPSCLFQVSTQLEPWHNLSNKVVLVTGASSGIGREFCLDLARAGCKIIAAARRLDRLESLCNEINNSNIGSSSSPQNPTSQIKAVALELDVCADAATIKTCVDKAWNAFGKIDALINNAGVRGKVKTSLDMSEEEWQNEIQINLTGSWLTSKYVGILMREGNHSGSVIFISSISAVNRGLLPGGLAYAVSKTGVNTMTKMMALELGVHKIRVNSISPGLFRSEITEGLMQKSWLTNVAKRIVPLREHGTIDPALTSLVRYLIHDSTEYVSGNNFIVDAGVTLPGLPIFSSL